MLGSHQRKMGTGTMATPRGAGGVQVRPCCASLSGHSHAIELSPRARVPFSWKRKLPGPRSGSRLHGGPGLLLPTTGTGSHPAGPSSSTGQTDFTWHHLVPFTKLSAQHPAHLSCRGSQPCTARVGGPQGAGGPSPGSTVASPPGQRLLPRLQVAPAAAPGPFSPPWAPSHPLPPFLSISLPFPPPCCRLGAGGYENELRAQETVIIC